MSGIKRKFGLAVVGIALVDVLAKVDEAVIAATGMAKGGMSLIDAAAAAALDRLVTPDKAVSGGSAANSLAGFAAFGGPNGSWGAMIGKVADDRHGRILQTELKAQGLHYATPPHKGGEATGCSYILITPDGERTMGTHLGVNSRLSHHDVDEEIIGNAHILLIEGYAFDQPGAKDAVEKAVRIAKEAGTRVAFTLSDSKCVERHRADFTALVRDHVDILLGNEKEAMALTGKRDFNAAAQAIGAVTPFSALTRGRNGALIQADGVSYDIAPVKPRQLVDTTGAGDAFAAGVLYGLAHGFGPRACGELGAKAASLTISEVGARPRHHEFPTLLR